MKREIRSFKDLDAWNVAMEVAVQSYELARRLPATERFGLSAQIRRAAVSVPANVAEGQATGQPRRFLYHSRIALGSLGELETDFEIAKRLGLLTPGELAPVCAQIARSTQLLHGLVRSLRLKLLTSTVQCLALFSFLPLGYFLLSHLL